MIEPNTQIVFGIGSIKSYQLKEGYLSSSNYHDFQMACHDDGIWIGYQSGVFKSCTFIFKKKSVEHLKITLTIYLLFFMFANL